MSIRSTASLAAWASLCASFVLLSTSREVAAQITGVFPMYGNPLMNPTTPASVNNSGQSVATFQSSNLDWNAVFHNGPGATAVDPFPLSDNNWIANGINDAGAWVGQRNVLGGVWAYRYGGTGGEAAVQLLQMPTHFSNAAEAMAINNAGEIVGVGVTAQNPVARAFKHPGTAGGVAFDLGTLGTRSTARSINNKGVVVGESYLADQTTRRAFIHPGTPGGAMTDLGTLANGIHSAATDINDGGMIVGYGNSGTRQLAFINSGISGQFEVLPTPFNTQNSFAYSINNGGYVVGQVSNSSGSSRFAALWLNDASHTLSNLDQWLDDNFPSAGSAWELKEATAISDTGFIVGRGRHSSRSFDVGFLLDASVLVPEPSGAAVVLGLFALTVARRRG
jgi:probable HAF family extracellular repeat protein